MDGPLGTSAKNKYGNYGTEIYDEKNPLKGFFEVPEESTGYDDYEDPELITIGTFMSFYPNFISILYRFYLPRCFQKTYFIQILFQFNLDKI